MKALTHHGPGRRSWEDKPRTTICGTDLHTLKGDVPSVTDGGWILGHLIDGTQAENVRIPHADSGGGTPRQRGRAWQAGFPDPNTTPMLLKTLVAGRLQPRRLITHEFKLDDVMKGYDTFANAAKDKALRVIIRRG